MTTNWHTAVSVFAGALIAASSNSADGVIIGAVTGNKYKRMSSEQQELWFVGALDGMMAESFGLFGVLLRSNMLAETPEYYVSHRGYDSWLGDCLGKYDIKQIQAVFEKQLEAKPEAWHAPAALIAREVIIGFCRPVLRPDIKGYAKP